jgi:hypothetical protein
MFNGRRTKTVSDLSAAHAGIAAGAEITLGIQRGPQMMNVSFPKADPKDLPMRTMRIVTNDEPGTQVFPAVGVALKEKDNAVIVGSIVDAESTPLKGLDVKAGDIIRGINGKQVSTVKAYAEIFDAIVVGGKVIWQTERKGVRREIIFVRPKPMGRMIIRQKPE